MSEHLVYVAFAYAVSVVVLAALVILAIADWRRQKRELRRIEDDALPRRRRADAPKRN